MPAEDGTMSVSEAAAQLGISRQMLTNLVREGSMPAMKVYGMWRVRVEDVEAAKRGEAPRA